jgi:anti-anti-sigma factor
MTAMPNTAAESVSLLCDQCGTLLVAAAANLREPDVVWPVLREHGWTGSPFTTGVHHCQQCAARPDAEAAEGRTSDGTDDASASRSWHADLQLADGAVVLTPSGDITTAVADEFRRRITEALRVSPTLIIDLSAAPVIDPGGLAALVRGHCEARDRDGALCLVAASRFIVTALHTMRLDAVFPVFPDRRTAVAQYANVTGTPRGPVPHRCSL